MRIIISNTVVLNGGDYAILEAIINLLKEGFGSDTEFIVYDLHGDIATKYYPHINFRQSIFIKNKIKKKPKLLSLNKIKHPFHRFLLAAKVYANLKIDISKLLLTNEERTDFQNYRSADIIISTGGTYLVENYSLDPRFDDYELSLALRKPLVFFTQSLGPFRKPQNVKRSTKIFSKASLILLRDQASLNNLKELNINLSKARVCADVVFANALLSEINNAKYKDQKEKLKVGISVRDWKFFVNRSKEEGLEKYFKSIAAVCEYITRKGGEITFISTCQAIEEYHVDDSQTASKIYDLLSATAREKTKINSEFHTPDNLKVVLRGVDIVISTRMHLAIQALTIGVPVLPIAYEFKTKELFRKLIAEELILDIDSIEEEQAVNTFEKFMTLLPTFREHLFTGVSMEHDSAKMPIKYLAQEL